MNRATVFPIPSFKLLVCTHDEVNWHEYLVDPARNFFLSPQEYGKNSNSRENVHAQKKISRQQYLWVRCQSVVANDVSLRSRRKVKGRALDPFDYHIAAAHEAVTHN